MSFNNHQQHAHVSAKRPTLGFMNTLNRQRAEQRAHPRAPYRPWSLFDVGKKWFEDGNDVEQ